MVKPIDPPADTAADAKTRAWRTLAQSLLADVVLAVVLAAGPFLADVHWSKGYWVALAVLAARSAITAAVSWAARHVLPPDRS